MALDVDRLRAGLTEYRGALAHQRERLQHDFHDLDRSFESLWSVYGGQMAEEFRHKWGSTAEWFEKYLETTERLDRFLDARIEQLRNL